MPPANGVLEMVVQVSNHDHRRGGLWHSIVLGPEGSVVSAEIQRVAWRSALFGFLVAVGLYHLLMYRMRTKAAVSLYFGLLTLLMAVKTAVTGELLLMRLIPGFSWHWLLKAEYWTYELGLPLFFLFLRSLFPYDVPRVLVRTSVTIGLFLAVRTLFVPTGLTSETVFLDQVSSLLFGAWALIVLMKAVGHGREYALLLFGSCMIWLGTIVNDILYANQLNSTGVLLTPVGVLSVPLIHLNRNRPEFELTEDHEYVVPCARTWN